jgi:hypothetical protein
MQTSQNKRKEIKISMHLRLKEIAVREIESYVLKFGPYLSKKISKYIDQINKIKKKLENWETDQKTINLTISQVEFLRSLLFSRGYPDNIIEESKI